MHDEIEPQDESPPDDVGRLLEEVLNAAQPRAAFVETLSQRLDEAFAASVSNVPIRPSSAVDDRHLRNGQAAVASANPENAEPAGRRRGRLLACYVLAALLLMALFVWSGRPSYSWASMIAALESKPWVEALGQRGGVTRVRGWVSLLHHVTAVRGEDDAVFVDMAKGVRNTFSGQQQVLIRQALRSEGSPTMERALLGLVLAVEHAENRKAGVNEGLEISADSTVTRPVRVLDESWQRAPGPAPKPIELDVVLDLGDREPNRLTFLLDAKSHLPMTCRLVRETDTPEVEIDFAYPTEGPRDVRASALGIPAKVRLVDLAERAGDAVMPSSAALSAVAIAEPEDGQKHADDEAPIVSKVFDSSDVDDAVRGELGTAPAGPTSGPVADSEQSSEEELPPARSIEEMSRRVDELLATCWQANGIRPTSHATDAEYLRRLYLDLTGRIPHVNETRAFLLDGRPDRREILLEELLDRYDHASHLAAVWRRFLLPDGVDLTTYGGPVEFERWLTDRFRDNVPYDEVVRELLLAEGRVNEAGPLMFYTALKLEPERIAAQTSRAFLGTRMECAQCHDHFFDTRWTQDDFWAYAAFFARISRPEGKIQMVSPVMRIQDSSRGDVTLPDSEDVVAPRFPEGEASDDAAGAPSRRRRLAAWLTAPDNSHFARATVNRVWEHLFGKGLVDPVDDMRPDNEPICPQVLDELAEYFVRSGFDLRRLIQTIVLSQAYQLSSAAAEDDPSSAIYFAQMNVKSFTAEQLFDSIAVATLLQSLVTEDGDANSVRRFNNISRQEFLEQFRAPPGQMTDYHAGIPQALTLMNGRLIESATDLGRSGILRSLDAPFFNDEQRLETLFLATLARVPDHTEHDAIISYLTSAAGEVQRREALSDVLWALLNTAEFTMNH